MIFTKLRDPHFKSGALYRVGLLLGWNTFSQAISLTAAPFILRMYAPAHFGLLGVYISTLGLLAPVAMVRYEFAVPGAQDDRAASRIFLLCVGLAGCSACLVGLGLALFRYVGLFTVVSRSVLALLLPLGVFLTALYNVSSYCAIRRGAFPQIGRTKVSQSGWMVFFQLFLGRMGWKPGGLLLGHVFGQSGGSGFLLWQLWRMDRTIFHGLRWQDLKDAARANIRFPKLSVPGSMLEACSNNLPTLILASFYGTTVVGWITQVFWTIRIPLNVLAQNISMVNFADFAKVYRADPVRGWGILMKRIRVQLLFGLVLALIIGVAAPWAIRRFLNKEWGNSITCLYLLLPMIMADFIVAPFGCVLDAFRRQDLYLVREAIRGGLLLSFIGAGIFFHLPWQVTLGLMSGASVLGSLVHFLQTRRALRSVLPDLQPATEAPTVSL